MIALPERKFYLGQKVRIVSKKPQCEYGWNPDMTYWLGKEATVRKAEYHSSDRHWRILLAENEWAWDENCFEEPDSPVVIPTDHLNSLL